MRVIGRALLTGVIGVLFVLALNVTANGLASLTLQHDGPVLAYSLTSHGDLLVTWLGTTYMVETRGVQDNYLKLCLMVQEAGVKAEKKLLPEFRTGAEDIQRALISHASSIIEAMGRVIDSLRVRSSSFFPGYINLLFSFGYKWVMMINII